MWLLIITSAILTTWLDLFFLPGLSAPHALYAAVVGIALFAAYGSQRAGFLFALTAGVFADLASSAVFGTHLALYVALFGIARLLTKQFVTQRRAFSMALLAAAVALAGVGFMAVAAYALHASRTGELLSFFVALPPWSLFIAPLFAGAAAAGFAWGLQRAASGMGQWLFLRKRTR